MNKTKRMGEKQFQKYVLELARLTGWKYYHTHNSRRSPHGFPDLVLVRPGHQVIFAELKSETGKTSEEQDKWLELLRSAGARVYLWRPEDLEKIPELLNAARIERTEDVRIVD